MKFLIGVVVVCGCVLGGFVLSHGNLLSIWQPLEWLIICGAALGAFIIGNPSKVMGAVLRGTASLFIAPKFNSKAIYMDLLKLQFEISTKIRKAGLMSIEQDVDAPENSELFKPYPKILKDHHVMTFITDNLRVIVSGNLPVHELESLLDRELDVHHAELEAPSEAMTQVSDGLPGFGIVAAVLGIVTTMSMIGGDPRLLGMHVGAALVGTFSGILFAYGFVGPMARQLAFNAAKEAKFYECIKVFLLAVAGGAAPQLVVEYARRALPNDVKPGFFELEQYLKGGA